MASLYLIEILHQTTTAAEEQAEPQRCILSKFYIKPQRPFRSYIPSPCCILSKFYIKPQLSCCWYYFCWVVSYRNSTSNHNTIPCCSLICRLYLIEILHQTTTLERLLCQGFSCILSKFYIKPQPRAVLLRHRTVVSYRNSTSNHNRHRRRSHAVVVVSYRNSTSNHNSTSIYANGYGVVSYRNSTSNHNRTDDRIHRIPVVSYRNSTSNHNSVPIA